MTSFSKFFIIPTFILLSNILYSQMPTVQKNWWKPNGIVYGIEVDTVNQKVYVGGSFDYIGPKEPYIGMVDTNGNQGFLADHPDGEVEATISDGKGGWYIGGRFSYVGDSARAGLAHLDSRGKVTGLFKDVGFNESVKSLSLYGDTLFVGGDFSSSGKFRLGSSFIDTLNGKVDFSFPQIKGGVGSSVADGNGGWYIGGTFTKVGDSLRNGYAHITATGSITNWNPIHNYIWGTVLGVKDQYVYIAGNFTEVDGQPRKGVAAVHKITGHVNQWAPDVTGHVRQVAFYGDSIYLGGAFGSNVHNNGTLVLFDTALGVPSNWNSNIGGAYPYSANIDEMKIMGNKLYVHGKNDTIGGVARDEFAAFDLSTKTVSSWNPTIYSQYRGMLFFNDKVYIYGESLSNPFASSYCFVEYDTITGTATNTNRLNLSPVAGSITSAYYHDGQVYINGRVVIPQYYFTKRTRFKFNTSTWVGAPWSQFVVNDDNGGTFSGGNFLAYGEHSTRYSDVYTNAGSKYLKAVSISNDTSTIVTPNPNGNVRVVRANEKGVFVGGDFDSIGVHRKFNIAKLNAISLAVEPWGSAVNGAVQDIVIDDTTLFVVGDFLHIGGVLSQRIAALRLDSAIADPWIAGFYNGFEHHSIAVMDSLVFTAGKTGGIRVFNKKTKTTYTGQYYFTGVPARHCGISNNILYGVGKGDKPEVWINDGVNAPRTIPFSMANGEINDLAFFGDKVFVGGDFDMFGGVCSRNLVSLDISTGRPDTSRYNRGEVTSMTSDGNKLYLSYFLNIATLNMSTQVFGGVNTGTLQPINYLNPPQQLDKLKAANGKVYIIGGIDKYLPLELHSYFFALDESNPQLNSNWISYFSRNNYSQRPYSVLPVGDSVFLGGYFNQLDSVSRISLCVLDDSIGAVSSFNVPVTNNTYPGGVSHLSQNGNSLFIGGKFRQVGTAARLDMAKINLQTHQVEPFNPSIAGRVTHLEATDSIVFVNLVDHWDTSFTSTHYGLFGLDAITGNIIPNGHFEYWGTINRLNASGNLLFVGGNLDSHKNFIVMGDCIPMSSIDTVIACDSYTWVNGITYYESVLNDSFLLTSQNGCDSIAYLNLTINQSGHVADTISACYEYTWVDGITYYESNNTAQYTFINQNGCDSIVSLNLTISHARYDSVTICNEYTWRNGVTYFISNSMLSDTVSSSIGCDSVYFLNLTILDSNTTVDVISACDSITWLDGNTYTSNNNTAIDTLLNSAGCDSIVNLDLTMNYASASIFHDTACSYYLWLDGNYYAHSTNSPTYVVPSSSGCDSVLTLNLIINQYSIGVDTHTVCDSLVWIDGQTYYSSNNTATHVISGGNSVGCDSTIRLDLTVLNVLVSVVNITACDSFTWNGITYTSSTNTPTDTLTNVVGCDSVLHLNLTIHQTSFGTDVITACDSLTWINGVTYYSNNNNNNNNAMDTLINAAGCDSVVTLDLNIIQSSSASQNIAACDSVIWINGVTYFSDTSDTYVVQNNMGCDSVITLDLTINHSTTSTDSIIAVNQYTWIDGITYFINNSIATHMLHTINGCDSLVTLYLEIQVVQIGLDQEGSTLTATADSGTFQWVECPNYDIIPGATDSVFNPTQNGSYAVIVTQNGFTDTSDCIAVNNVGIGEVNLSNNINIYPNPVHDQVNIEITNWPTNVVEIVVRDIAGKQVYTQEVEPVSNQETIQINTSKWAKGTYFIEVGEDGNRVVEKIVVQ